MKDSRKIYWICLLLAIATILFAVKAKAQSGTFDQIILKDKWGEEVLKVKSTITILPGKLKIVEDGVGWFEEILTQSKNGLICEIETQAGRYLIIFEGECLKRAYLRSWVGADRVYLSAEIFEPKKN